jgi:hypothetical protein
MRHLLKLVHMGYRAITENKIRATLGLRQSSVPGGAVGGKKSV